MLNLAPIASILVNLFPVIGTSTTPKLSMKSLKALVEIWKKTDPYLIEDSLTTLKSSKTYSPPFVRIIKID